MPPSAPNVPACSAATATKTTTARGSRAAPTAPPESASSTWWRRCRRTSWRSPPRLAAWSRRTPLVWAHRPVRTRRAAAAAARAAAAAATRRPRAAWRRCTSSWCTCGARTTSCGGDFTPTAARAPASSRSSTQRAPSPSPPSACCSTRSSRLSCTAPRGTRRWASGWRS